MWDGSVSEEAVYRGCGQGAHDFVKAWFSEFTEWGLSVSTGPEPSIQANTQVTATGLDWNRTKGAACIRFERSIADNAVAFFSSVVLLVLKSRATPPQTHHKHTTKNQPIATATDILFRSQHNSLYPISYQISSPSFIICQGQGQHSAQTGADRQMTEFNQMSEYNNRCASTITPCEAWQQLES
jgi:hypothetical protein